ncbi:MAG: PorT family protein [Chitinophagaceae bacterium]|nr:PorT family protein [Chitinophagaceae bacterium]
MIRRISFIILLSILSSQFSQAQFRMGPTGGVNFNRQVFKSNSYRYEGVFTTRLGFHAGIITDLIINRNLSLQTELLYTLRGGYFKTDRTNIYEEYQSDLGYISMPLCLTGKFDVKAGYLIAGAGPYLSKLLHSQHTYYSNGVNVENGNLRVGTNYYDDQIKPWDAGIKVKAGFELKKGFYAVAFYDISTTDINPKFQVTRNKTYGIQFAYIFSTTEEDRYDRFEKFYEF